MHEDIILESSSLCKCWRTETLTGSMKLLLAALGKLRRLRIELLHAIVIFQFLAGSYLVFVGADQAENVKHFRWHEEST